MTHRWRSRPVTNAPLRALWTCVRCGVEAETPLSAPCPSGARGGSCFRRVKGGEWVAYQGPLGVGCGT